MEIVTAEELGDDHGLTIVEDKRDDALDGEDFKDLLDMSFWPAQVEKKRVELINASFYRWKDGGDDKEEDVIEFIKGYRKLMACKLTEAEWRKLKVLGAKVWTKGIIQTQDQIIKRIVDKNNPYAEPVEIRTEIIDGQSVQVKVYNKGPEAYKYKRRRVT